MSTVSAKNVLRMCERNCRSFGAPLRMACPALGTGPVCPYSKDGIDYDCHHLPLDTKRHGNSSDLRVSKQITGVCRSLGSISSLKLLAPWFSSLLTCGDRYRYRHLDDYAHLAVTFAKLS
ncbi:hypothetical protein ACJJTC_008604 [Scirpophaga incertulas]